MLAELAFSFLGDFYLIDYFEAANW